MNCKKLWMALVSILVVVGITMPVAAVIYPRYGFTNRASSSLGISGSTATAIGKVEMAPNGESITMTVTLNCDGKVVQSWSTPTLQSGGLSQIKKTVTLTQRGTYTVTTNFIVYGNGGYDSDSVTSGSKVY